MCILSDLFLSLVECATTCAILAWAIAMSVRYYDKIDELCRIVFGFGLDD